MLAPSPARSHPHGQPRGMLGAARTLPCGCGDAARRSTSSCQTPRIRWRRAPLPRNPEEDRCPNRRTEHKVADRLVVRGAREHNLKDVSLDLPRDALIVFTGLSGSGKSSLAFDTIFAEGQRRYVESLSAYARQFLGQMDKPDVDFID